MRRFYSEDLNVNTADFSISGSENNHLKNALRSKEGEFVEVFNGLGLVAKCEIIQIGKDKTDLKVTHSAISEKPHKVDITLICSFTKGIKTEFVVEKATELGVSRIVFYKSERSIVAISSKSWISKKVDRLKVSSVTAAKQCELNYLPLIEIYNDFKEIPIEDGLKIVCYEEESKKTIKDVLVGDNSSNVTAMIGPEGGFSKDEIKSFKDKGFQVVGIGKNILKAVTAAIAVVAMIGYEKSL